MISKLLQTLNIFAQLKTYRILKNYEKADVITQEQFQRNEFQRITKNRYDMQAYLRLSIMRPKSATHYRPTLKFFGFNDKSIDSTINRMQKRYPRTVGALLTRIGATI